jgi:hypothetical protein
MKITRKPTPELNNVERFKKAREAMSPNSPAADRAHNPRPKQAHAFSAEQKGADDQPKRLLTPIESVRSMAGSITNRDMAKSPDARQDIGKYRVRRAVVGTLTAFALLSIAPQASSTIRSIFDRPSNSQLDTSGPDRVAPAFANSIAFQTAVENYQATTGIPAPDTVQTEVVTVQSGDTVWDLANSRTTGDPRPIVDDITRMNYAEIGDGLDPGDQLRVPVEPTNPNHT